MMENTTKAYEEKCMDQKKKKIRQDQEMTLSQ